MIMIIIAPSQTIQTHLITCEWCCKPMRFLKILAIHFCIPLKQLGIQTLRMSSLCSYLPLEREIPLLQQQQQQQSNEIRTGL